MQVAVEAVLERLQIGRARIDQRVERALRTEHVLTLRQLLHLSVEGSHESIADG